MAALGRAYIEVHADTRPFAQELGRDIGKIIASADKAGKEYGNRFGKSASAEASTVLEKEGAKLGAKLASSVSKRKTKVKVDVDVDKSSLSRLDGLLTKVASNLGDKISGIGKGITGFVSSIGSSVGNVGSNGPFALILGTLILLGAPAVIGGIIGLTEALVLFSHVLVTLPAGLFVLAAAIAPVIIAFQGFNEAVTALNSGDPKAIQEALKGLAPAAQRSAREVAKLAPIFREIKNITQQAFFSQLAGTFTKLGKVLGPSFIRGFQLVGFAVGQVADQLFRAFASPAAKRFFDGLFQVTSSFLFAFAPALGHLVQSILDLMTATLPFVNQFGASFAGLIDKLATFIDKWVQSGGLKKFIEEGTTAGRELKDLIESLGKLVGAILGDAKEDTGDLLQDITDMIDDLTKFFKSDIGQKSIKGMIALAKLLVAAFVGTTVVLGTIIAALGEILHLLQRAVDGYRTLLGLGNDKKISGTIPSLIKKRAMGTITSGPEVALIGEAGPEVVVPLTNPRRAQELADASGLTGMLGGAGGNTYVYIGADQIDAYVERRVSRGIGQFARSMSYGPRTT